MLSRVAESIFWMARYVERAENLARFLDVTLNLSLDQPQSNQQSWEALVLATGDGEFYAKHYGEFSQENVVRFLAFDRKYAHSIISCLAVARENARTVRETISSEAWEQLNEFYHFLVAVEAGRGPNVGLSELFRSAKQYSHLFNGVLDATMTRDQGWHFANVGRLIERADKTARILDVKYFTLLPDVSDVGTTIDDLQWSAVLRSVSGFEMYRKRYHSITVHRVVGFLILDRLFPRAVQHCVIHADDSLHELSGSPAGAYSNQAEQRLGRLRSDLAYSDVDAIVDSGMHQFIDRLQVQLNSVGEAIDEVFFRQRDAAVGQSQRQSSR